MVVNGITNASQLREKLPAIKDILKSCLRSRIGDSWQLTPVQKETPFSLKFNVSSRFHPGETVKVDLLPTFEASIEDVSGTYLLQYWGYDDEMQRYVYGKWHALKV